MTTRDDLSNRIATALVHHAARRVPTALTERLEEEWLADLAAQDNALSRLRFALGCCWARQVLAHDPLWVGAAAAQPAVAHGVVALLAPTTRTPLSRRTLILSLIVGLHGAAIYAFIYGIGGIPIAPPPTRTTGTIINTVQPRQPPIPMPGPKIPQWTTVPPDIPRTFDFPQTIQPPSESTNVDPQPLQRPAMPVARVMGGPGRGFPATADYYPAGSIRLEETGVTAVQVCTDGAGRLTAEPAVTTSSGFARLDAGALALARAGSGHYRSTTEDGKPVASCFAIRVRFALNH